MRDQVGLLKAADKGTVLFDEISDMPLALQFKLLQALQKREYFQLGSDDPAKFDVRMICATNKDPAKEVREGRFREELLYRINVITIRLPALREREGDIPLLANHFLHKHGTPLGRSPLHFSKEAMRSLVNYRWPGNVRELENTIERAAILADTDVIHTLDLPETFADASPASGTHSETPGMTLEELEREHIRRVLSQVRDDKVRAAQILGIHLSTLYRKVLHYRLDNGADRADTLPTLGRK
jgi:DNA-binding NtrC family response regulator